jgi:hypothetical protein
MHYVGLLEWPAMVATLAAAWLVASRSPRRRVIGFWLFLGSNVLWVAWGWHAGAYALIVLQIGLALINVRGANRNEPLAEAEKHNPEAPSGADRSSGLAGIDARRS